MREESFQYELFTIFLMVLENVFAAYPLFVILIIYILLNEHDNDDLTELLGIQ